MHRFVDELRLLQSIRLAVVATDRNLQVVFVNDSAAALFATPAETAIGQHLVDFMASPAQRATADDALDRVLNGDTTRGEMQLRRSDGSVFLGSFTVTPVRDAEAAIAGTVSVIEDITETRRAEEEAQASEQRLLLAHEAANLGTWQWDLAAGTNEWDDRLLEIWGLDRTTFDGTFEAWASSLHPDDADHVLALVREAMDAGTSYVVRHRIVRPDGSVRTVESNGQVTTDDAGSATGTIGVVRDVTDEAETARSLERAFAGQRLAAARSELLREITADFAAARTVAEVERVLAQRLVEIESLVEGAVRLAMPHPITEITDGTGFLTSGNELTGPDRDLLDHLAAQVALAADRAHLLARTSEIAEHLQSSLAASPVPVVPGIEVAVHYAPGGDELEHVGGDWYDAVETLDGALALVVGDVMGRGVRAATTMIRVRAGIRALLTVNPAPEVVLSRADRVVIRDAPEQFVTAVVALVDPHRRQIRLCSAGHVPVIVAHPDGRVDAWGAGSGVPLGILDVHDRQPEDVPFGPGATVVMVTDGVVERRDSDLDQGIDRLTSRLADLRDAPLPILVADLARLADPSLGDDVTVVAARLR